MAKHCKKLQARLTDILFGEESLDQDEQRHLAGCPECAAYAAQLRQVQAALDSFSLENGVDEARISKALLLAEAAEQKQQGWHEALLFILTALFALLLVYGLCALYDTYMVLYLQGFFYLLTPVLMIPLIRKRASRTDPEEVL